MATKADLLAEITSRSLRVIQTELEADTVQQAANINRYRVNALVVEGGRARAMDTFFYVIDEGTQNEEAYYRRKATDEVVHSAVQAYVDSLIPNTFARIKVTEVNEADGFALADAYESTSATEVTLRKIMVGQVGQSIVHRIVV